MQYVCPYCQTKRPDVYAVAYDDQPTLYSCTACKKQFTFDDLEEDPDYVPEDLAHLGNEPDVLRLWAGDPCENPGCDGAVVDGKCLRCGLSPEEEQARRQAARRGRRRRLSATDRKYLAARLWEVVARPLTDADSVIAFVTASHELRLLRYGRARSVCICAYFTDERATLHNKSCPAYLLDDGELVLDPGARSDA